MFQTAVAHHQAGRLAEAEAIYRRILNAQPNNPDALHLLGLVGLQMGQPAAAADLIGRAIAVSPLVARYHGDLGRALESAGRLDDAIAAYRRATELDPRVAEAYNKLANALRRKGNVAEAQSAYRQAIALKPEFTEAHYNLAELLREAGQIAEAAAEARAAVSLRPDFVEAQNELGVCLDQQGQTDSAVTCFGRAMSLRNPALLDAAMTACREGKAPRSVFAEAWAKLGATLWEHNEQQHAVSAYQQSIKLRSDHAQTLLTLGGMLQMVGAIDEAISLCRKAVALQPDLADAHFNLGTALRKKGQLDEAMAEYTAAIGLSPEHDQARVNLGSLHQEAGRIDAAIAEYRQVLSLNPGRALAHHNLGLALLLTGDFEQGLPEYEWRRKASELGSVSHEFPEPMWDGGELDGRRILLHTEQGFGDAIQFARYVPMVAARGGRVILQCQTELTRLFGSLQGINRLISRIDPVPVFDVHCPLLSLPLMFKTTLQTIPTGDPYLHADEQAIARFRAKLPSSGRKIGLAWAGLPTHKLDSNRSVPLATFSPLGQVAGTSFISLQKGSAARQARGSLQLPPITDWTSELSDFADTAALISALDLVITVDTAVAHLAGALGKPVWVLLPFAPDWRWMLNRTDSPWYPTLRLFRQPKPGDWETPVQQIAAELAKAV